MTSIRGVLDELIEEQIMVEDSRRLVDHGGLVATLGPLDATWRRQAGDGAD